MINKLYRKLLPSQILSSLSLALCNQIDAVIIGLFCGVNAMTAYGLFAPMVTVLSVFGGLFSTGIASVCAQLFGKGDKEGINGNYATCLVASAAVSLLISILCFFGAKPLALALGAEAGSEIFEMVCAYCKAYALGVPFYLLLQALTPYLHLVGKRSLVNSSVVIMSVVDIVLDLVSGVMHWGMYGIALASSISYFCALLPVALFFLRKDAPITFSPQLIRFASFIKVAFNGMTFAINEASFALVTFFSNQLLLKYVGEDAVAAFTVVNTLGFFVFFVCSSSGNIARILSGVFYGEGNRENLTETVRVGLRWCFALGCTFTLLFELFPTAAVSIYLKDANTVAIAIRNLRLYAISLPFTAATYLLRSYYQSTERTVLTQIMTFVTNGLLPILFAVSLTPILSAAAVWLAIPAAQIMSFLVHFVIAGIYRKEFKFSAERLAMLRPDFGFPADAVLDISVRCGEDAALASVQTAAFCKAHGKSASFSNFTALCVEELTVFLLKQHEQEAETHEIFVRIAAGEDHWILQLRDNYESFDFAEYMKLHHSDDAVSHLGIRIVFHAAEEATYVNVLGLNSLLLKLADPL